MHVQPEPASAGTSVVDGGTGPARGEGAGPMRRDLSRDTILFGLGSFAGKVVGFLTLPVFTRLLDPDDFGRLDVLNALASSGILILMLGTDVAAVRLYFDRPSRARRELLASWIALAFVVQIVPSAILVVGGSILSDALFGTRDLGLAVSLVGVTILAGTMHFVGLGVLRASGRPLAYSLLEGGALAANAILAILLLLLWQQNANAVMLALAVSWSMAAIVGLVLVWRSVAVRPSTRGVTDLLRLGLPLTPAVAATWGADFFHRAYLLGAAGATQAGYLSVAIRFASVATLVVTAVQIAWHPHVYRRGDSPEGLRKIAVEGRQIIAVLSLTVGLLGLITPEAVGIIGGERYAGAIPAVGMALVGVLGLGLFAVASIPSALARATKDIATAVVAGVFVAVVLSIALAPTAGAVGTAISITVGQVSSAALAGYLGIRRCAVRYEWVPMVAVTLLGCGVVSAATLPAESQIMVRIIAGAALLVGLVIEGTLPVYAAGVVARRRRER